MKKTLIITIMLAAGIFYTSVVSAQSYSSIQYTVGIPTSGLKDHTSLASWRGITMEFHGAITPQITVGLNLSYSLYYERKSYDSYNKGTATLTGIQYRYNNVFPMLANVHYLLNDGGPITPYVGFGMGTVYDRRYTDMGVYSIREDLWHFLIAPEAGLLFNIDPDMSIKFNAIYDYGFKTNDADAFGSLRFNLGLVFNNL